MRDVFADWQSSISQLPWYRRPEFVYGFFAVFLVYVVFLAPPLGGLGTSHAILLTAMSSAYIAVLIIVQQDRLKPMWLKNATALGLLLFLGLVIYRYSGARWGDLGHNFFNLSVMARGDNWLDMFRGLWIALKVFLYSLVFSTILGLFLAVLRSIVDDRMLNVFIDAYADIFRAVPPIVALLVTYSALPYSGIVLSPFATGVLTLTLIEAAYLTEVFRSGIEAIHRTQVMSARSLGLTAWKTMRLVVLPQSVRIILPDYTNRIIGLMKRTAETSVIAIAEILQTAQQLQSEYVNATPLIVGAIMYMIVLFPLARLASYLEKTRPQS